MSRRSSPVGDLSRRELLSGALAAGAGALLSAGVRAGGVSRDDPPSLAPFDRAISEHMEPRQIPGGALAVLRAGRLVHARGYGLLARGGADPVGATSLFRIASLSKPITAIAVLRLVEAERMALDDSILKHVKIAPLAEAALELDARWERVTVRQCLQHSGGWDRNQSFDPMFRSVRFARELGIAPPAGAGDVIRAMRARPLDFDPGTRYAYSNFGYCLLGRAIEAVAGATYEAFVRQQVLAQIGASGMRIGHSLLAAREKGEARYHLPPGREEERGDSAFGESGSRVPAPDGGFCLEAMDAHGGWIASVVDLARVLSALDAPGDPPLLRPESRALLFERPAPPLGRGEDGTPAVTYYGCGWMVREIGGETGRLNTWHTGSLPGTSALMVRRHDGLAWVALFNQRQDSKELPDGAIDGALHRAADAVEAWPKEDLFARFG